MRRRRAPAVIVLALLAPVAGAQPTPNLTLQEMVTPSSRFTNDRGVVRFALHGFVEFERLDELFAHVDGQAGRWKFASAAERDAFADRLLRKGVESRLVSMVYDAPRELLVTYTPGELAAAVARVRTEAHPDIYAGRHWRLTRDRYRDVLLAVQARWKTSLNCWSAAPSIPARVLSNWYVIAEGIELYGAAYESTEHFWQAVKYHPDVTVGDVLELLARFDAVDWEAWLRRLDADQETYLEHTYAVEFLRATLARRGWFRDTLRSRVSDLTAQARALQQRTPGAPRFTPLDEKILWGDLADLFHLVYFFAGPEGRFRTRDLEPLVAALAARRFDGVYIGAPGPERVPFISPRFQQVMLEIWKVKFLRHERFGDVIRSIDPAMTLDHFLNDGDSPDIPIPIYVRYLNEIRDLARRQTAAQR